jgi:hypothetical protein
MTDGASSSKRSERMIALKNTYFGKYFTLNFRKLAAEVAEKGA